MIINLSLADVFGPAATQTATTITIAKSDLPTLTPSAANSGQALLVGILLKLLTLNQILSPNWQGVTLPKGGLLSYPTNQNPLRLELWRINDKPSVQEIIFTFDLWS